MPTLSEADSKELLGPFGVGYLWVAPEHREGRPLEENWINRAGAEDFARLTDYPEDYRPGARRFDVGQRTHFHLTPMAVAAVAQLLEWGVDAVAASLAQITARIEEEAAARSLDPTPADPGSGSASTDGQPLFVGGEWVAPGGGYYAVVDPATEETVGWAPEASRDQVHAAGAAAREAFGPWSRTAPEERAAVLARAADIIHGRLGPYAELAQAETGATTGKVASIALAGVWTTCSHPCPILPPLCSRDLSSRRTARGSRPPRR